jgi:hypothetical protein
MGSELPPLVDLLDEVKILPIDEKADKVESVIWDRINTMLSNWETSYFEIGGDHFHLEVDPQEAHVHWPVIISIRAKRIERVPPDQPPPEPWHVRLAEWVMSFEIVPRRKKRTEVRGWYGHEALLRAFMVVWGYLEDLYGISTTPKADAEPKRERLTDADYKEIRRLYLSENPKEKKHVPQLADQFGVSVRRIYQILEDGGIKNGKLVK